MSSDLASTLDKGIRIPINVRRVIKVFYIIN